MERSGINEKNNKKVNMEQFRVNTNKMNNINKKIAVLSGKGGVGKSLMTSLLAVLMRKNGYNVGVLDADITGPSIPKIFGAENLKIESNELGMYPPKSNSGISLMSINFLLKKRENPVIWRGPLLAGAVKQFWTDVIWGDLDYLFFDLPPGTGDVPLTIFQAIPLDGIIIITSPQDLVSLIVKKAYNMAKEMNVPIIGIIENMSYVDCPECKNRINIFGEGKTKEVAKDLGIKFLGSMPIDVDIARLCDRGEIEKFDKDYLNDCVNELRT